MLRAIGSKSRWLPLLLLIIAALSLFWPAVRHPFHILYPSFAPYSDIMVSHWPKITEVVTSWKAGEGIPLWTPLMLSGMPLAVNQSAMLSYPPAWLFLLLPTEPTFNLLFVFHMLLGATGTYLLVRRAFHLSRAAAFLAGLTFMLNGKWLAHMAGGHVSMAGAIGWLPWVLFGLHMLLKRGAKPDYDDGSGRLLTSVSRADLAWALLAGVGLMMQAVTHTLLTIYSIYLIAAIVSWHFIAIVGLNGQSGPVSKSHIRSELKRLCLPLLLIPVTAGLLSAGQLFPLIEMIPYSNRSLSLADAEKFSLSQAELMIGLFLPTAKGGHELIIYMGLVSLLITLFGLRGNNRWSWFYAGLFIFALLFALGPNTPIHGLFYHFAPGFRLVRTPARIFFVGGLSIAILVGFGLDRLRDERWSPRAKAWLTRLGVAGGALALLLGIGLLFILDQSSLAALTLIIFVPVAIILIGLRVHHKISRQALTLMLGLILYLDLATFGVSLMRFISLDEALASNRAVAEFLANQSGLFRVYSPSYSLPIQSATAFGLRLADGIEGVHLAIYDQFMARAGGYQHPGFTVTIPNFGDQPPETALKAVEPDLNLLGMLNVQYVVSAFPLTQPGLIPVEIIEEAYIYHNEQSLPRARVVHQAVPIESDWLRQLEQLPNLGHVITIETEPQPSLSGSAAGPATISHYASDLIEIETAISEPGWLVLSELWYPGWRATVNGVDQPVVRVNGLLRGLFLTEPGQYKIVLEYKPLSVRLGYGLAGLTAVILILTGIWLTFRTIFA